MTGVTTYGKWEAQKQILLSKLISDTQIASKKTEEINIALLKDVHDAMFNKTREVIIKNIGTLPDRKKDEEAYKKAFRELTIKAYQESLTVVLDSLAKALGISSEILKPHVQAFCNDCEASIPVIIDAMMDIGDLSIEAKMQAVDQLYGKTFRNKYPSLTNQLLVQDKALIEIAVDKIKDIKTEKYGQNEAVVCEQKKYIIEVAPSINPTEEFQKLFSEQTEKTMDEYKILVAETAKHGSLWDSSNTMTNAKGEIAAPTFKP